MKVGRAVWDLPNSSGAGAMPTVTGKEERIEASRHEERAAARGRRRPRDRVVQPRRNLGEAFTHIVEREISSPIFLGIRT